MALPLFRCRALIAKSAALSLQIYLLVLSREYGDIVCRGYIRDDIPLFPTKNQYVYDIFSFSAPHCTGNSSPY